MMLLPKYEVETRIYFNYEREAYERLPFLKETLKYRVDWVTSMHGRELFAQDRILRFSKVWNVKGTRYFIGYKEPDIGDYCNVRSEVDEEVTDGFSNSAILKSLGIMIPYMAVENLPVGMESAGYPEFMSFKGYSLMGKIKEQGLSLKLMFCDEIEFPVLFEIEKNTENSLEISELEKEILGFIADYDLSDRIVNDEPTTLLYKAEFGNGDNAEK